MRKGIGMLICILAVAFCADAQVFSLVKDINTGLAAADPAELFAFGDIIYFRASDGVHGAELWKSNGTENGTFLIRDIYPGPEGAAPSGFLWANGVTFFHAKDGIHGDELWKTDGTEAGTTLVKDIYPGAAGSQPSNFIRFKNLLYFTATNPASGVELWRSDGTEAGTVLVKDINASGNSNPQFLTAMGNFLYFSATDGVHAGADIWKTDGTNAGTVFVKDVYPGSAAAQAAELVAIDGTLYFTAGGNPASTLWKSDGTEQGTQIVKGFVFPAGLTSFNNTLYFQGRNATEGTELWKTDGTDAGTIMAKDIRAGSASANPQQFIVTDTLLYFIADDGSGQSLWRLQSNGTAMRVKKVVPENARNINGTLYFSAWEGTGPATDKEIWISDGTEAGTLILQNIAQNGGSSPAEFTQAATRLFITAGDAVSGRELWVADLTTPVGGLPLTMLEFKGEMDGPHVVLSWKTVAEHNTSHFEIERSTDGSFFSKLNSLPAAGSSTITRYYTFNDAYVNLLGVPAVYYRLKMKDLDGHFTYSRIIAVNLNSREPVLMLYPNPASAGATLLVSVIRSVKATLEIMHTNGHLVNRQPVMLNKGSNIVPLATATLPSGVYFVVISDGTSRKMIRFSK